MMEVIGNIPYIATGEDLCQPRQVIPDDFHAGPEDLEEFIEILHGMGSSSCGSSDGEGSVEGRQEVSVPSVGQRPCDCWKHGGPLVVARSAAPVVIPDEHYMCHKGKHNKDCEACMRGGLKQPMTFKGAFDRELKQWGDIITMDHLICREKNEFAVGITGDTNALDIKDLFSKLTACYPSGSRSALSTEVAIKHFIGRSKDDVVQIYSDNSGEIANACAELKLVVENSQVANPKTNAIIERANQDILVMTRKSLVAAGIPACWWPYCAPTVCFNDNTAREDGEESAWSKAHGKGEFVGTRFPFGCGVWFKPSPTKYVPGKWDGRAMWGIFAGCKITLGYKWAGDYFVWDLPGPVARYESLFGRRVRGQEHPPSYHAAGEVWQQGRQLSPEATV